MAEASTDIPLRHVPTNATATGYSKQGPFQDGTGRPTSRGHRLRKIDSKGKTTGHVGYDGEEDTLNRMGQIYQRIKDFSIITRYFVYVLPLALCIAIPIIVGATAAQTAEIGGVRIVWFFTWVEIVWLSLWVSKTVAHFLPILFQLLAGVVSSGVRKYALVIRALEIPLSLVGWALTSLATFVPVST